MSSHKQEEEDDDNWWCTNDNCLISHPAHYNFCHHCGAQKPDDQILPSIYTLLLSIYIYISIYLYIIIIIIIIDI